MGRVPSLPQKVFGKNTHAPASVPGSATSPVPTFSSNISSTTTRSLQVDTQHPGSSAVVPKKSHACIPASKRPPPCPVISPTSAPPPVKKTNTLATPRSITTSQKVDTRQIQLDRLGTLVRDLTRDYSEADSWETFVTAFRGRSYLADDLEDLPHPAAPLLKAWRDDGVPVQSCASPWTLEQKDAAVERGCHPSANLHSSFVREEMAEFIENNFWMVLPYDAVRDLPNLMFTPLAVKDERDRKPRLLMDHSWPWEWGSINELTLPGAPPEAMQFGHMLSRLVYQARHADPKFGAMKSCKHDVKDGYYRMFLSAQDCPKLAALLPRYEGEPQLIGIPMSCTMGWAQSPPTFCAMSETACDLVNDGLKSGRLLRTPAHRLSATAESLDDTEPGFRPRNRDSETLEAEARLGKLAGARTLAHEPTGPAPSSNRPLKKPVAYTDVFVDDFVQLAQGSPTKLNAVRNVLFHTLDHVLRMPSDEEPNRNEAVSLKKMAKGDSSWHTRKLVIGWIIDFIRQTLELPPHRMDGLVELFESLRDKKRVSEKNWQRMLGKLRFVALGIPGCRGLFSALQLALNKASAGRIRVTAKLRHHLDTFASLAADVISRPTHLAEIVPEEPALFGAHDAAKLGMGGVFWDEDLEPRVWRFEYPEDVKRRLVSSDNLSGDVTNSDFEQAGRQAQLCVMADNFDLAYCTIENGTDNTPALSRGDKGAVSSDGPDSLLCNEACEHQRLHRYCAVGFFIPGEANVMADDSSRLFHLSDTAFLAHFEQRYPQSKPWQLCHLPPQDASRLISALRCQPPQSPMSRKHGLPRARTSQSGLPSALSSAMTLPCGASRIPKTRYPTSSSSLSDTDVDLVKAANPSELALYRRSSRPSVRGSPTWVSRISDSRRSDPDTTIPYSLTSWPLSGKKTIPLPALTPSTRSSCALSKTSSTPNTGSGALSTPSSSTLPSSDSSSSCDPPNT